MMFCDNIHKFAHCKTPNLNATFGDDKCLDKTEAEFRTAVRQEGNNRKI